MTENKIKKLTELMGFSDFVHRPDSKELKDKKKHDVSETGSVSETSCFKTSNSLQSGRWNKSETPLILCYTQSLEAYRI
jgi:hypothetical protein